MSQQIIDRVSPYQTIIWDWNGTLLNDADIGGEAEARIFKRYGLPVQTREERLKNFFMPIEKYYEKMGFDFTKVSYDQVSEEWMVEYQELAREAQLFRGIADVLDYFHNGKRRQFVLSAAPESHLHEVVSKHSIFHYFEAVYGLPNARADSKIQRGKELLSDHKIDPATAVLIGDTTHDHEVGTALGVDILLIGDGHHSVDSLLSVHHNVMPSRF